jgi:hypothetical protein|tara:strand:- start:406 stop:582 length:177 start_codon:yes stop_codon:yes gene_type:complete
MIQLVETSEKPVCPFCEQVQQNINFQALKAFLGKRYLYSCTHCRKVLGISHRNGIFMG